MLVSGPVYPGRESSCVTLLPSLTPQMSQIYPTRARSVSGFLATADVQSCPPSARGTLTISIVKAYGATVFTTPRRT